MTTTHLQTLVREGSLPLLNRTLDAVTERLGEPNPKDPNWIIYSALRREYSRRMREHYATVSDEELVAVLLLTTRTSMVDKPESALIVGDVVEMETRVRFPTASVAADAYLDGVDLDNPRIGEYDDVLVLAEATGVSP